MRAVGRRDSRRLTGDWAVLVILAPGTLTPAYPRSGAGLRSSRATPPRTESPEARPPAPRPPGPAAPAVDRPGGSAAVCGVGAVPCRGRDVD
ncbi:hypothetical protein GCM10009760_50150 [Kitasatospora kazusensis]|uniref:Secreted protein n=1 Tax=Kitasatospora kazusensis TaxID=407974 RepID=A0ABN3A330_9ACTN